jgi:hypothetical protein
VAGGLLLGLYGPRIFALGGWVTAVILSAAAFTGRMAVQREARSNGGARA